MPVEILYPKTHEEWLDLRRPAVTASIAGCLLGVHPYETAYDLWAIKSGLVETDDLDNAVLRRGRLLEPVIFAMLREERPSWAIEYPLGNRFFLDRDARIGATPDSFATRPDIFGQGTVQGKTIARSDFDRLWVDGDTGDIVLPLWIAVQALVEASLTGCTWAAVAVLIVDQRRLDLEVIDVPLNTRLMDRLRREVREFWRMVDAGEEPPIDWNRDGATVLDVYRDSTPDRRDLAADIDLDNLVGRYVEARQARLMSAKIEDTNRPQIIRAMGPAEAAFTANWHLTARTMTRVGDFGQPIKTRVLRVKPREDSYADRF
jgi:hypothetical protein